MAEQYFGNAVSRTSAELAYFLLFAVFPLTIFANAVIASFNLSQSEAARVIMQVLPSAVRETVTSYLIYLESIDTTGFAWLGIVLTLYSVYRVVNAIFYALNKNYVRTRRSVLRRILRAALFALSLVVTIIGAVVLISTGDWFINLIGGILSLPVWMYSIWQLLRIALVAAVFFLALLVIYLLAPSEHVRVRDVIWGTLFAAAGLTLLSTLFSFYVDNLTRYPVLYGSIGTVLLLMLWLYFIGNILVLGGEINYVLLEMKREED